MSTETGSTPALAPASHEPPDRFRAALAGLEVLAWAHHDLTRDAHFIEGLVVLLPTELARLEPEGEGARIAERWPLDRLPAVEVLERDGWILMLTGEPAPAAGTPPPERSGEPRDARVELVRATVAHLEGLASLRESLVHWREDKERPGAGPRGSNPCATCGRPKVDGRCPHCRPWHRTLSRLLELVRPHARAFTGAGCLLLAGTVLGLAPPYLIKVLVDDVLKVGTQPGRLAFLVGAMGFAMLVGQLIGYGRQVVDARLTGILAHQMRVAGVRALSRFGLAEVSRATTGGLAGTLLRDVDQVLDLVLTQGFTGLWHLLMIVGILGALAWLDFKLMLVCVIPAPILISIIYRISVRGRRIVTRLWAEYRRFADTLHDVLDGFRVVKAFHAESDQARRLEESSDANRHWEQVNALHYGRYGPMLATVTGLASLVVWGWGGYQVIGGQLSVGSLVAYVSYLGMLYGHVQALAHVTAGVPRHLISAERYFELVDTVPTIRAPVRPVKLAAMRGLVVLERVSFSYKAGREVLRDVDLTIQSGEMIGLVGKSGAGKTTLVNLVARFYDPMRGRVTMDGVDLRELDMDQLRDMVGVVLQIPFLFEGTVLENLRVGRPAASLREVCLAADRAQAHDFIMALPDGYDTVLRTGGHSLSAGERQRLTIARALLKDPRVLILDEATASVDTQTEKRIQDALAELVTGRTTIAIAHRLSTLGRADRLVVMDGGKIVDSGPHHELVCRPGLYRDLVTAQEEMTRVQRMRGGAATATGASTTGTAATGAEDVAA